MGSEQQMVDANYDENSQRKFTRLHLLGADGLRALRADVVCYQWGYYFTQLMAQKPGEELQSAFAAVEAGLRPRGQPRRRRH